MGVLDSSNMLKYLAFVLLLSVVCVLAEPEPYRGYGGYGRYYGGYRGYRGRGYGHYGKRSAELEHYELEPSFVKRNAAPEPYRRSYRRYGGYYGYRGYGKRSVDIDDEPSFVKRHAAAAPEPFYSY